MTLRAVITGFFCAAFLCGFCFFNDHIIRQSYLVRSYLPLSVFGGLLLFVICVNPLLGRIHRRLPFSGRELAVVVAMVLVACGFPEFTCAQILPCVLMLPHYFVRTDPGWLASGVLDLVPKRMLADPTVHNGESLIGFARGMGTGVAHVRIGDITWSAWTQTLGFWLPVIAVLSIGALALSVIIHRQWARHEHLPYPVAAFVQAILPDVLVKGADWAHYVAGREIVEQHGGKVVLAPLVQDRSTTNLIDKIVTRKPGKPKTGRAPRSAKPS